MFLLGVTDDGIVMGGMLISLPAFFDVLRSGLGKGMLVICCDSVGKVEGAVLDKPSKKE